MRIVTIVGARPQFIKAAVVSLALRSAGSSGTLVDTGQHYDQQMSAVFFEELHLPAPTYSLGIGSGTHGDQTGRMLAAIERVLIDEQPDQVLVYGDTNSTLAGALAAAKLHIPVAHVEAGLRSFNRRMPEEVNRVLTDHVLKLLFTPTQRANDNLAREGVVEGVHCVGDVMYDVALRCANVAEQKSDILQRLELTTASYILATIHRAENTDDRTRLQAIFEGLAKASSEMPIVLPLHPRTRGALAREGILEAAQRSLILIEPVGYLDMTQLLGGAALVVTDSGGLQKEAFFHRVPAITLRDETEWIELTELGWNQVLPPRAAQPIADAIRSTLRLQKPAEPRCLPYGDGNAAKKIAQVLGVRC